jgi:hypothetical protein
LNMSHGFKARAVNGNLEISAVCSVTQQPYQVLVPYEGWKKWSDGEAKIQVALPNLSAEEREFVKSGITPAEWRAMLGTEE